MGQLASVQNPLGQLATLVYNGVGQQVALINALGNRVSYTYNANGIVQSVQNPSGAIVTYLSDQVNRLTTYIDALGNISTYQYDYADAFCSPFHSRQWASRSGIFPAWRVIIDSDAAVSCGPSLTRSALQFGRFAA